MSIETRYFFRRTDDFPFPQIFDVKNVWEVLPQKDAILRQVVTGRQIAGEVKNGAYLEGPVHIGAGTVVKPGTVIEADPKVPIYIGENCTIGPHAYIRKGTLIGNNVEIGRTEVKGSVILNDARSHHHGYIGDSIIGRDVNIATAFDSGNLKHTGGNVRVVFEGTKYDTGQRKFGCVIGDFSKTGCKTTAAPGTLVGPNVWIDEGAVISGFLPENTFLQRTADGSYRVVPLLEKHRKDWNE